MAVIPGDKSNHGTYLICPAADSRTWDSLPKWLLLAGPVQEGKNEKESAGVSDMVIEERVIRILFLDNSQNKTLVRVGGSSVEGA